MTVEQSSSGAAHHGRHLLAASGAPSRSRTTVRARLGRAAASSWRGAVLLLMIATVFWTASTTWLRAGSGDLEPVSGGSVCVTGAASLFLLPATLGMRRDSSMPQRPSPGSVAALAVAGMLAVGIGGLLLRRRRCRRPEPAGPPSSLQRCRCSTCRWRCFFLRERVTPRLIARHDYLRRRHLARRLAVMLALPAGVVWNWTSTRIGMTMSLTHPCFDSTGASVARRSEGLSRRLHLGRDRRHPHRPDATHRHALAQRDARRLRRPLPAGRHPVQRRRRRAAGDVRGDGDLDGRLGNRSPSPSATASTFSPCET